MIDGEQVITISIFTAITSLAIAGIVAILKIAGCN